MASISPLLPLAPPAPQSSAGPAQSDPVKIEHAAKAFESLLIGQILKSSHADGSANWLGSDDDPAGDSATELAEEQFAQALASRGGLGLAKLITQGLSAESTAKVGS
jgi:Rod binding domain-containing protein